MNKELIIELFENKENQYVVVACNTKEECIAFSEFLNNNDIYDMSDESYVEDDMIDWYEKCKKFPIYFFANGEIYSSLDGFDSDGLSVLEVFQYSSIFNPYVVGLI